MLMILASRVAVNTSNILLILCTSNGSSLMLQLIRIDVVTARSSTTTCMMTSEP